MPKYKRLFLDGYSYFLTIVTYKRNPILIENIELLRESFAYSKRKYSYTIDAIVVLPEHFHIIITPQNSNEYPKIVATVKSYFSRHCNPKYYKDLEQSKSRDNKGYKPIWQKRYFEHTIRDEKDFKVKLDYIHYNPYKHKLVDKVIDWKYSTFKRYLELGYYSKDWCDFDEDLDFE